MAANVGVRTIWGEAGLPVSVAPLRLLWHLSADQAGPLALLTMDLPLRTRVAGSISGQTVQGVLERLMPAKRNIVELPISDSRTLACVNLSAFLFNAEVKAPYISNIPILPIIIKSGMLRFLEMYAKPLMDGRIRGGLSIHNAFFIAPKASTGLGLNQGAYCAFGESVLPASRRIGTA